MKKKNSRNVAPSRERLTRKRTHSMTVEETEDKEENNEKATIEDMEPIEDEDLEDDEAESVPTIVVKVKIDRVLEEDPLEEKDSVVKSVSAGKNGKFGGKSELNILTVSSVHVHDHNNNAVDMSDSNTIVMKEDEMSVDENSRQGFIRDRNSSAISAAGDEKAESYEDSMCSSDPGDRVINTNLYGTDVDPSYLSPSASTERILRQPTPQEQQQQQQLHVSPAGSQIEPHHIHPNPTHTNTPTTSRSQEPEQDESSYSRMSISNQGTKESGQTRTETRLTSFGGIFKQANSVLQGESPSKRSIVSHVYPQQSYEPLSSPQQDHVRYQNHAATTRPVQHGMEDSNMAAEQLATELVRKYSGQNSEMISDILKPEDEPQFVCPDFARNSQEDLSQYADGSQAVLHDVDLLNTPQQLCLVDELYHHHGGTYGPTQPVHGHHKHTGAFGTPQASSTPDRLNRSLNTPQTNLQGSYTCNDVQLHGVKWTSGKDSYNSNNNQSFERSENPCQPSLTHNRQSNTYPNTGHFALPKLPSPQIPSAQSLNMPNFPLYQSPGGPSRHPRAPEGYFSPGDFQRSAGISPSDAGHYRSSRPISHERVESYTRQATGGPGVLGLGPGQGPVLAHQGNIDYGQQGTGEITKMTFTPRQMMETHLSQVNHRIDPSTRGHAMSEMDYSSIYPKREFIESTVGMGQPITRVTNQTRMPQNINPPPKKRHKMTPCASPLLPPAPPAMPIIDDMFAKSSTPYNKEVNNNYSSRQKYHVLNPSEATSMTSKALLCKYIDFLILENEQITEISKSVSPPVDIYVTEDMYFMDSLKYRVPFPSKKLTEWVSSFYPKLNFWQMNFKNQKPKVHPESVHRMVDSRPTQQILEDTFYFFQREIMNYDGP